MVPIPKSSYQIILCLFCYQRQLHLNHFWKLLTGGKFLQALTAPCITDPWPSVFLNWWKRSCVHTDKQVFLNCPLWENAVLKAWFTNLLNTYVMCQTLLQALRLQQWTRETKVPLWGLCLIKGGLAINKVKSDGVSQGATCHGVNEAEGRRLGEKRSL